MKFIEFHDVPECDTCLGKECRYYEQCHGKNCKNHMSTAELFDLMPYDEDRYKNYDEYREIREILLGF